MDEFESLSHSKWECKYHTAFIPKCRGKVWYRAGQMQRPEAHGAGLASRTHEQRLYDRYVAARTSS